MTDKAPAANRALVAGLLLQLATLLWVAVYFLSVYQAYKANGFWKALIVAIPIIGQLLWAGVQFYSVGLFNSYFYVFFAACALYVIANLIGPKPSSD